MKFRFIRLAKQNMELMSSHKQLSNQLTDLQSQFQGFVEELNLVKKQREKKDILRKARLKRKKLPK